MSTAVGDAVRSNRLLVVPAEANELTEEVPVRLLNLTETDLNLPRGVALAECEVRSREQASREIYWFAGDHCARDFQGHLAKVGTVEMMSTEGQREEGGWSWEPSYFPDILKPLVLETPLANDNVIFSKHYCTG